MRSDNAVSIQQLMRCLNDAFPSLTNRTDLRAQPPEEWIKLSLSLALLTAERVVDELPFVLVDAAQTAARGAWLSHGDMIVIFLDVLLSEKDLMDPAARALIERFADEQIGGAEGAQFKAMFQPLPGGRSREEEVNSRLESFIALTLQQRKAVLMWLRFMEPFFRDESVHDELMRAMGFWYAWCHEAAG